MSALTRQGWERVRIADDAKDAPRCRMCGKGLSGRAAYRDTAGRFAAATFCYGCWQRVIQRDCEVRRARAGNAAKAAGRKEAQT